MKDRDLLRAASRRLRLLLGLAALLAPDGSRAGEWFLKIDGVPGEVTAGRFAGWTRVASAGALVCLPVNSTNATAGPAAFSCEVLKDFDRLSPWLLQTCGRGETNRRVTLACVLTNPAAIHRLTLGNARVASVGQERTNSSPEARQSERVAFAFDQIEMACLDLDAGGGTTGGLTGLFDQTTGQGGWKTRPPFRVSIARQSGIPGVTVTWPAENGHRYHILSRATVNEPWQRLAEATASADGLMSEFLPAAAPALFMRVDEVD